MPKKEEYITDSDQSYSTISESAVDEQSVIDELTKDSKRKAKKLLKKEKKKKKKKEKDTEKLEIPVRERYKCDCGSDILKSTVYYHNKSKKHNVYVDRIDNKDKK